MYNILESIYYTFLAKFIKSAVSHEHLPSFLNLLNSFNWGTVSNSLIKLSAHFIEGILSYNIIVFSTETLSIAIVEIYIGGNLT